VSTFPRQPSSRQGANQNVSVSAVSAASSAFSSQCYQVLLVATAACNFRIDAGTLTATTSDTLLPANTPLFMTVSPGQKCATVTASEPPSNVIHFDFRAER